MIHPKKRTLLSKFFFIFDELFKYTSKDEEKKRNILLSILIGAFLLCAVAGGTFYYYLFAPQFHPSKTVYIYVDRDDTADSIYHKIKEFGMSISSPDSSGWQNTRISIRISTPDVMQYDRMTTYIMYSADFPEVIRNR